MTDAAKVFSEHATSYDEQRRRLIPPYDALYGAAVGALALARRPLQRVLDLGAGTGLLAGHVAAAYPEAELTLLDGATAMLDQARGALGDRAHYIVGDLSDPLPEGQWDAIVSALAIHHLTDDGKCELFARVHERLAPGGVFVNAEQVAAPSALFAAEYARWHEHEAKQLGTTDVEWDAAVDRMRLDHWATVEHQLQWLREAGFADADCLFKDHRFAVLVGVRS